MKWKEVSGTFMMIQIEKKTLVSWFNFHPLEVVSRYRDPQLQVSEN